jgi:hypothetical protein
LLAGASRCRAGHKIPAKDDAAQHGGMLDRQQPHILGQVGAAAIRRQHVRDHLLADGDGRNDD